MDTLNSLDLSQAPDHPTKVIETLTSKPDLNRPGGYTLQGVINVSTTALREHEVKNNVTFAALSNEALTSVREAYQRVDTMDDTTVLRQSLLTLLDAVNGLLGLDNQ